MRGSAAHAPVIVGGGLAGGAAALRLAGTPSATFAHVQPLLDRVEDHLLARGWRSERSPVLTQRSCILAAASALDEPSRTTPQSAT
jgi:2-polyprenyl-6-methoxyphenol hydroxylase-like FAD-dependent oxidoreductase